jgi:hypothetical protein
MDHKHIQYFKAKELKIRAVCSTHSRDHKCLQNVCLKTSRKEATWNTEAYKILCVISRMDWVYLPHGKDKWWAILNM